MSDQFDIAIIGAGMAGASIAGELAGASIAGELSGASIAGKPAGQARILLVEAEAHPGYHTTGRSAAFWEECYGGPDIVPLTLASGAYLREGGFLAPRGALYISQDDGGAQVSAFIDSFAGTGVTIEKLGRGAIEHMVPGIRPGWTRAIAQPNCADIDVAGLHQHYLAMARRGGVALRCHHRLQAAEREGTTWRLDFGQAGAVRANLVVNAAGAWADEVATICGARPLGIVPYRRTVAQLRIAPAPRADLPLVLDLGGSFYFKPENGRLWLSPHDETPTTACDAAAEEWDIALAIDRLEQVVDWRIEAVERKWAGLRSFAPDRRPVYGFAPDREGFFWCAGQGGYGIQTAPAGARFAAQLLTRSARDAMTMALDEKLYSPARLLGSALL